ncbi:NAD(P)-binding protein, partial [Streptomyces eurythermus]
MLEPAYQVDVVIVGAGIAGLSAAHRLTSAGITTAVLEAAPYVGGRMSTEKIDGFRLDRVGQLLSTSYPELRLTPGLAELAVRRFAPGVLLHRDGRLQRAGAPAPGGSARGARGALHAVRALAGTPRSTAARATAARATTGRGTTVTPGRTGGAPVGGAVDQARLGAALGRLAATPVERVLARPELPAAQALARRGVPARTIDGFL